MNFSSIGDPVLQRVDGIFTYHLAVVVDDAREGVSEIVRGKDLFESTFIHLYLQQLLGYEKPHYYHVPIVRDKEGNKLSKQNGATGINHQQAGNLLVKALDILGQRFDLFARQVSHH